MNRNDNVYQYEDMMIYHDIRILSENIQPEELFSKYLIIPEEHDWEKETSLLETPTVIFYILTTQIRL